LAAHLQDQHTAPIQITVCADDYGLTPGVSRGIRELLAPGRISGTSVMAASEFWPREAPALKAFAKHADIGLHITLTDQVPLEAMPTFAPGGTLPPLRQVLRAALLRRLPLAEIEAEIERQLAAFVEHFGQPPAHIDGHHHIHQLPGIREIVVGIAKRLQPSGTYVRSCHEPVSRIVKRGVAVKKALLISSLGRGLAQQLRHAGLPTNSGFSGAYDYGAETRSLTEAFGRFLEGASPGHLVMCHPGYNDAILAGKDTLTSGRETELAFFTSDAWPRLVTGAGVEVGPLIADLRHA
jgi:chitin disaccharide deacetylase